MVITETILNAFRESPEALRIFGGNIREVERSLTRIDVPQTLDVEQVQRCREGAELSKILAHLPAKEILRYFGQDVLLWTWLTYSERGKTKTH